MIKTSLMAGSAVAALLITPGAASAQTGGGQAALEARIAQLEAELTALKTEVVASRSPQASPQPDILLL